MKLRMMKNALFLQTQRGREDEVQLYVQRLQPSEFFLLNLLLCALVSLLESHIAETVQYIDGFCGVVVCIYDHTVGFEQIYIPDKSAPTLWA
jgi:hypothetical protein